MAAKRQPAIPRDISDAIERAWPDGIIEMLDEDEPYFWDIQSKLERNLRGIKSVDLLFERGNQVERKWYYDFDDDEDPDLTQEENRSYHLYLLSPKGKPFHCKIESEAWEEEDEGAFGESIPGDRDIGLAVGISLVAPLGIIVPSWVSYFRMAVSRIPIFTHTQRSRPTVRR